MRKPWRLAFVALVVFLTASSFAGPPLFRTDFNYYSDGTFATWVGEEDHACDGQVYNSGTTSDWRIRDRYNCWYGGDPSRSCWEFVNGSWTTVTCP